MILYNIQTGKPIDLDKDIDIELKHIILFLNENNYPTEFCCKGRYEGEKTHDPTAYIKFVYPLKYKIKDKAKELGLYLDGDCILRSAPLIINGITASIDTEANREFISKIKELFSIKA